MALEPKLIELIIIEGSKFRSQAPKGPDEAELRCDVVDDATEPDFLSKLKTTLRFALHLDQLISCRQHVSEQMVPAITRMGNGTNFVCGIEGATHQVATKPDMSRPGQDDIAERLIRSSLKAL